MDYSLFFYDISCLTIFCEALPICPMTFSVLVSELRNVFKANIPDDFDVQLLPSFFQKDKEREREYPVLKTFN